MIRQKLQQTLKQQTGKVFPLPPPMTVPSCTVFCHPTPSSLFHPFPGSNLCLSNTACDCQSSKETVLKKSTPHSALRRLSWGWRGLTSSGQSRPRETELGIDISCPPTGRALKRVLHAHSPSTGWTVEGCVGKTNSWLNE